MNKQHAQDAGKLGMNASAREPLLDWQDPGPTPESPELKRIDVPWAPS